MREKFVFHFEILLHFQVSTSDHTWERMAITVKIGLVCFAELVTCTGKVFQGTKPNGLILNLSCYELHKQENSACLPTEPGEQIHRLNAAF